MKKKLTIKMIENLPPAADKRYEVRDELLTGLVLRVSTSGAKVWCLAARVDGTARRIKLGNYPVLSLKEARERAQAVLRDIQLGEFQRREKRRSEPKAKTFGDIMPLFIQRHSKRHNKDWKSTERLLSRFKGLHKRPLAAIKRADVVRELEQMVSEIEDKGGKGTHANRGLAAIKKFYAWSIDQGIVETSPVAGMKPLIKEISRDRWLCEDEIKRFWEGCEAQGYPFCEFGKLLLLTGQRLSEIAEMRWSELDMVKGTLTLKAERTKNSTLHVVPLPRQALALLEDLPRYIKSDFVFTTTGTSPISGFGRFKKRLDVHVGLDAEDWRMHDLRRTAATMMAVLKVPPHVIEAVLNHKSGVVSGVAAVYNRHAYFEEKRIALQTFADHVDTITQAAIPAQEDPRRLRQGLEAVA